MTAVSAVFWAGRSSEAAITAVRLLPRAEASEADTEAASEVLTITAAALAVHDREEASEAHDPVARSEARLAVIPAALVARREAEAHAAVHPAAEARLAAAVQDADIDPKDAKIHSSVDFRISIHAKSLIMKSTRHLLPGR